MKRQISRLLLSSAVGLMAVQAQAGTLYFDFNRNYLGGSANASVFLFGDVGQTATVSNLAGFSQDVVLNADGFFNLSIPNTFQQAGTGIRNTGFKVESSKAIGGYFVNRQTATTDMTYLTDSSALGKKYVVASQGSSIAEGSQVMIHATQDNTAVTFTPKGGAPINVVLQAGETYKYAGGSTDLTGSLVSADKNVAVFGGHACANVPSSIAFCDVLLEQMIATENLSKRYALTASRGAEITSLDADIVRVIATENNTEVKVGGVVVATLDIGEVHEFRLPEKTGTIVEATKPVAVAQYLLGGSGALTDPAMAVVPGSDTWLKSYRLATPTGGQAFDVNYASVVIPTPDLMSLFLDGVLVDTSLFTAIGGTNFSRGIVDLPLGLFTLSANNPFLLMLGGGSNADSYFTYGGSTFAPGISPPPPPPPPPPPTGVPEPASAALMGAGLLLLATARRRRKAD